jgi:hypothetical protein
MICATVPFGNAGSDPHARTSPAVGRGTDRPGATRLTAGRPALAWLTIARLAIAGLVVAVQAAASVTTARPETATADRIPRISTLSH